MLRRLHARSPGVFLATGVTTGLVVAALVLGFVIATVGAPNSASLADAPHATPTPAAVAVADAAPVLTARQVAAPAPKSKPKAQVRHRRVRHRQVAARPVVAVVRTAVPTVAAPVATPTPTSPVPVATRAPAPAPTTAPAPTAAPRPVRTAAPVATPVQFDSSG
ncbi:MAG: hypothetical protein QOE86_4253 [Solirubrobacteraceae bacterium]|nr:hypothetical protein [Solirubrobacteraceae bacterium]